MPSFSHLIDSFLALLFPERCAGCGQFGHTLCLSCCMRFVPYSGGVRALPGVDAVNIAYVYQNPVRQAVHQLKYRRRRHVAKPLGEMLGTAAEEFLAGTGAVVPVPMHAERRAERGFNQAEEIAKVTASMAGIPCLAEQLVRTRATGQQVHLNARERQENMRGAFAWRSANAPPNRVVILDDVMTTGATISACALALREAGCSEVKAVALARSRPDFA